MLPAEGYVIIRQFLSPEICSLVLDYVELRYKSKTMMMGGDPRIPGTPVLYGDPLTETLLVRRHPFVEELLGEPLWPSYSYLRRHTTGAAMSKHVDREGSEIGVTVTIGGDALWPLWFQTAVSDRAVTLEAGDAVVYKGRELPHWREPYGGQVQVQCMLFYVRQLGPCAQFRFDGREGVGLPQVKRAGG